MRSFLAGSVNLCKESRRIMRIPSSGTTISVIIDQVFIKLSLMFHFGRAKSEIINRYKFHINFNKNMRQMLWNYKINNLFFIIFYSILQIQDILSYYVPRTGMQVDNVKMATYALPSQISSGWFLRLHSVRFHIL
ncbi:uncharacterized protein LOC143428437 [Xylocopa sonorina]|uniref:uncharacterized protein LOC143428437 n=1 Tax=Xylocopa sonorina TaxID=1818115 RepID=UPI00403B1E34